MSESAKHHTPWSPLSHPVFRALWIANLASNVGTWMQNVGAGWLMLSLSASTLLPALVQTATSLPMFFLALPAGALADVVNRRWLLIVTQTWMLAAALALGALTVLGLTTPSTLLALTFLLGIGSAMNTPAWQAIVPELVPRKELQGAVALSSVSFNVARAVGPALGGIVIARAGAGAAFVLNALSFIGVIFVLMRWRPQPMAPMAMPAERFVGAMRAGWRYSLHALPLKRILRRSGLFVFFASAIWSLLPLLARNALNMGAGGYGLLLGCLGGGALLGAALLPRLRRRMTADALVNTAIYLFALGCLGAAFSRSVFISCLGLAIGGVGWLVAMSTFNVAVMVSSPLWVRSRAVAVYALVFQGAMAIGGIAWGSVAEHAGLAGALGLSVGGLGLCPVFGRDDSLDEFTDPNHSELSPWPDPVVESEPAPDRGPVVVTVEYRIDPARTREFLSAMEPVREFCLRDGALEWELLSDVAEPGRYVEYFVVESWSEHLRQHRRATLADRVIQDYARSFHVGAKSPKVEHLIAEPLRPLASRAGQRQVKS